MKVKIFIDSLISAACWLLLGNIAIAIVTIIGILSLIHSKHTPEVYYPIVIIVYIILVCIRYKQKLPKEKSNDSTMGS